IVNGANGLLRLQSRTGGQSGRLSYQANVARLAYDGYRRSSDARNTQADAQFRVEGERDRLQVTGNFVDYDAKNPGSLSDSLLRVDRFQAFANNVRQHTGEAGHQGQLGILWRHRMEPGELEVSTYGVVRSLDNPIPVSIIDLDRRGGGVRALYRSTLRVAGRDMLWTVGSDVDAQHDDRVNHTNQQGQRGALTLDQIEKVSSLAGFAQLSAPVTDRVSLLGSLRYDNIRFTAEDRLITATNPDDSGRRSMDRLSPSLGMVWNLGEALGVYGNYATSFQTPTTTELANRPTGAGGFNPTLEPEHTRGFEVGARGRLGPRVDYQLAAFRALVENELIGFEVPQAPGRTYFRNAGSAVHRGVEAELSFAPVPEIVARVAYTYTDAKFRTYRVGTSVYDGNLLPGIAPHRLDGVLSFQPGPWYVDLDARYESRIQVNDANTAASPAYALLDARAGLAPVRLAGLRVAPFVGLANVLDRRYNTSVVINAAGARYFEPGPGRAFHAGATLAVGRQ
ncbi:MAG TPA: TonB-dependent receptor, partial [Longimicrobiales bacterium]|nr:TonB-dependent receptor [Longimicrobiales bacterium]